MCCMNLNGKDSGKLYVLTVACADGSFSFLMISVRILLHLELISIMLLPTAITSSIFSQVFIVNAKWVTSSALTPLHHKVSLFLKQIHKRHLIWSTNRTSSNQLLAPCAAVFTPPWLFFIFSHHLLPVSSSVSQLSSIFPPTWILHVERRFNLSLTSFRSGEAEQISILLAHFWLSVLLLSCGEAWSSQNNVIYCQVAKENIKKVFC